MRISFAGGGSDLPPFLPGKGGRVVGSAIELRVRAVVEPFDRGWVRLELPVTDESATRPASGPPSNELAFRLLETALQTADVTDGVRLRVETNVAPGAGLGGSASAAVAVLSALYASVGQQSSPLELARAATLMERKGLSILCGSQDQIFAAFGGVLDLSFDETGCSRVRPLRPPAALASKLEDGLLLVDTDVRRVSGEVLDRIDRERALASVAALVAAADEVADALEEGSLERVLVGMRKSAEAKLSRDPAASALAVELGNRLLGLGVEVIRACGAGGGGHVLIWAPPEKHQAIREAIGPVTIRRPSLAAEGVRMEPR